MIENDRYVHLLATQGEHAIQLGGRELLGSLSRFELPFPSWHQAHT